MWDGQPWMPGFSWGQPDIHLRWNRRIRFTREAPPLRVTCGNAVLYGRRGRRSCAPPAGLEPAAKRLEGACSIH
jgi:hypothetical protein